MESTPAAQRSSSAPRSEITKGQIQPVASGLGITLWAPEFYEDGLGCGFCCELQLALRDDVEGRIHTGSMKVKGPEHSSSRRTKAHATGERACEVRLSLARSRTGETPQGAGQTITGHVLHS